MVLAVPKRLIWPGLSRFSGESGILPPPEVCARHTAALHNDLRTRAGMDEEIDLELKRLCVTVSSHDGGVNERTRFRPLPRVLSWPLPKPYSP